MAGQPRVGDPAPDFTLPGWYDGEARQFTLSAERGHAVVLAFYPRDGEPVSVRQLTAYSDELGSLTATGARIWGVSPQDLATQAAFAGAYGLKLPLLADTDRTLARTYGVAGVDERDGPRRAVVVVDGQGTIAWTHFSNGGMRYRSPAELSAVLATL